MVLRIVLALISITMFSTLLKIFTAARTAEIYAATAGYVKRAKPLLAMTNKPDLPLSLSSSSGVTTSRKTEKTGLSLGHFDAHVRRRMFPESASWIGVPYLHELAVSTHPPRRLLNCLPARIVVSWPSDHERSGLSTGRSGSRKRESGCEEGGARTGKRRLRGTLNAVLSSFFGMHCGLSNCIFTCISSKYILILRMRSNILKLVSTDSKSVSVDVLREYMISTLTL